MPKPSMCGGDRGDPFAGMDEEKARQARMMQASLDGNYSLSQRLSRMKEEGPLNSTQESDLRTARASDGRLIGGRDGGGRANCLNERLPGGTVSL